MIEDELEKLAVRIEGSDGEKYGSGILWVPQNESGFVYIFTAAHVVYDRNIKLRVNNIIDNSSTLIDVESIQENVQCHNGYDSEAQTKEKDVAVIRTTRREWMSSLPSFNIGKSERNGNIVGRGFPQDAMEDNIIFAGQYLNGKVVNLSHDIGRFQIHLTTSIDQSDRDSELKGYSGTGIFAKKENDYDIVLLGIFSYGQGLDACNNITNVFSGTLLVEICKICNWDIPEYNIDAPSSFQPYIELAVSKIENNSIREEIYETAQYIIDENITPRELINKGYGCKNVPICKRNNRLRCKHYWISKLQLLSIVQIMGSGIEDLHRPCIELDNCGETIQLPIEFVCSEGHSGTGAIGTFVRSLVYNDYAWENRLRNNSIVIWSSEEVPMETKYSRTRFSKIVDDICHDKKGGPKQRQLSIKYGESKPNDLSIIHIHELIQKIALIDKDNCTIEDIRDCIKELITNVIT